MSTVDIDEARTHLSRFVDSLEDGTETEIVILREGSPVAKLVPIRSSKKPALLGSAEGKWRIPDNIDELNPEIERLFYGDI